MNMKKINSLLEDIRSELSEAFLSAHSAEEMAGKKVEVRLWALSGRTLGSRLRAFIDDQTGFKRLEWIKKPAGRGVSQPSFVLQIKSAKEARHLFNVLQDSAEDGNIAKYRVFYV